MYLPEGVERECTSLLGGDRNRLESIRLAVPPVEALSSQRSSLRDVGTTFLHVAHRGRRALLPPVARQLVATQYYNRGGVLKRQSLKDMKREQGLWRRASASSHIPQGNRSDNWRGCRLTDGVKHPVKITHLDEG